MNKLTRLQTAKILGIGVETLRYYEDMNIVQPIRNEKQYRMYSESDIRKFNACRVFRSFDFSLKECNEILQWNPISEVKTKFKENIKLQNYKLEFQKIKIEEIENYYKMLEIIEKGDGYYEIKEIPEQYYFKTQQVHNYKKDLENENLKSRWVEYFPVVKWLRRIRSEKFEDRTKHLVYENGIAIRKDIVDRIGFPKELLDNVDFIEKGTAFYGVFKKEWDEEYNWNIYDLIVKRVKSNGYKVVGDILTFFIIASKEEEKVYNYHYFYVYIEKNKKGIDPVVPTEDRLE